MTGSVVGIQRLRVAEMYTGTLITELMAMVARAEHTVEQRHGGVSRELHEIFSMQIPVAQDERVYMGAA